MNNDDRTLEALSAWQVETMDVTARVSTAIATSPDVIMELRAMRQELAALRQTTVQMHEEITLLRAELARRPTHRLSPFSATESRVRLS